MLKGSRVSKMDLRRSGVTAETLQKALPLDHLEHLDLRRCPNITLCEALRIARQLPRLSTLGLPPPGDVPSDALLPAGLTSLHSATLPTPVLHSLPELRVACLEADGPSGPPQLPAAVLPRVEKLGLRISTLPRGWLGHLRGVASLEEVGIWAEGVEGEIPAALHDLRHAGATLRTLSLVLWGEARGGGAPDGLELAEALAALPNLEELSLAFNGAGPAVFGEGGAAPHLPRSSLKALRVNGVAAADAPAPLHLAAFHSLPPGLRTVSLASLGRLPPGAVQGICETVPGLQELVLASLDAGDAGPAGMLAEIRSASLRYLEVNYCEGGEEGASVGWGELLAAAPGLVSMLLYGTPPLGCDDVHRLSERLVSLSAPTEIGVGGGGGGGGGGAATETASGTSIFASASTSATRLRYFNIVEDAGVTGEGLAALLRRLPGLQVLQLEGCPALRGPVPLGGICRGLRELCLHGVGLVGCTAASSIASCPGLRTLVLELRGGEGGGGSDGGGGVAAAPSDNGVVLQAVSALPELHSLSLYAGGGCVGAAFLADLRSPSVVVINVYAETGAARVPEEAVDRLRALCPSLTCFHQELL